MIVQSLIKVVLPKNPINCKSKINIINIINAHISGLDEFETAFLESFKF